MNIDSDCEAEEDELMVGINENGTAFAPNQKYAQGLQSQKEFNSIDMSPGNKMRQSHNKQSMFA